MTGWRTSGEMEFDKGQDGPKLRRSTHQAAKELLPHTGTVMNQPRERHQEKVRIARRLRSETTMTLDWIAQRLNMGAAGYAAQCLRKTE